MGKIEVLIIVILVFCGSCTSIYRDFPQERKLSEYTKTEFLPTLENNISADKNSVYCVSLLYTWDKIRKELEPPLEIDSQLYDLSLLNNSKSYINTLSDDEYSSNIDVLKGRLTAKASFKKSLPFQARLTSFKDKLVFDKIKVASFGILGYDESVSNTLKILYYNSDNEFIIQIFLKDSNHEIILAKFDKTFETMSAMFSEIKDKIDLGRKEQENQELNWKYTLASDDEVVIPKLHFNISTNYQTLEGQFFYSNRKQWEIETAWQRTAFLLDQVGAEVESESNIVVKETASKPKESLKPKKMRFDKPFFLVLKKKNSENPYLGLWIANEELMEKE